MERLDPVSQQSWGTASDLAQAEAASWSVCLGTGATSVALGPGCCWGQRWKRQLRRWWVLHLRGVSPGGGGQGLRREPPGRVFCSGLGPWPPGRGLVRCPWDTARQGSMSEAPAGVGMGGPMLPQSPDPGLPCPGSWHWHPGRVASTFPAPTRLLVTLS